jgi:hypothetical protein
VHYRYPQERYVADPEIGHWLEAGQRAFTHAEVVEVNSSGLRDREYPREVPSGSRRILALGDSQTFGDGLGSEHTWPKLLEQALNARDAGRPRWEVVNAGLSATDTWQHEIILRRLARSLRFDEIVLGFYVNDVTPRYTPRAGAELTNTWSKRAAYVMKRSALFSLGWQTGFALFGDKGVSRRERRILTGEADPAVEAGWRQVSDSLGGMRAQAEALGARFTLLVLPRRDQVSGRTPGDAYGARLAAIAAELGIERVDALPVLREAYARHAEALFIPWDGHNSALANAWIVEELVRRRYESEAGDATR